MDKIRSLDLGCGENPTKINVEIDEYYGLDIIETNNPNVKKCDLFVETVPFESNYFDYVTAFDFLEHVPRVIYYKDKLVNPFIHVMNETYRVLKKDGRMIISGPSLKSDNNFYWDDPTHISPITYNMFFTYFCTVSQKQKWPDCGPWAKKYGFIGNFKIIEHHEEQNLNFKNLKVVLLQMVLQKI